MIDENKQNMKLIMYCAFALLGPMTIVAQEPINTDVVVTAVKDPKIDKLEVENTEYRAQLELLQKDLPALQQKAEDLKKEALESSGENRDAAKKLQRDVTDASKARKARKAARQAEKDSDKAEKAMDEVEKTEKKIEGLQKKIEKNEKKILKLKQK